MSGTIIANNNENLQIVKAYLDDEEDDGVLLDYSPLVAWKIIDQDTYKVQLIPIGLEGVPTDKCFAVLDKRYDSFTMYTATGQYTEYASIPNGLRSAFKYELQEIMAGRNCKR